MALPAICVEEEIADELVAAITRPGEELEDGPCLAAGHGYSARWSPMTRTPPESVYGWVEKGSEEGGGADPRRSQSERPGL